MASLSGWACLGRNALVAILDLLAPVLTQQDIGLPDPGLPDTRYFTELAAIFRSEPIKAAVYLPPFFVEGPRVRAPERWPAQTPPAQRPDQHGYSLRRERICWGLDFIGGYAQIKYETGLGYVACLFSQPDEALASATLFSKFSGGHRKDLANEGLPDPETGLIEPVTDGVGSAQLRPDRDEAEARSAYSAKLREYKETVDDLAIPGGERLEAQRAYDELLAFLSEHYCPAPGPGLAVTKLVHKSIRRLCEHLLQPIPGEKTPNPVATAFAAYITAHILLPSRRYTRAKPGARVRIARGELAGRLIFECPPGDRWSVHF